MYNSTYRLFQLQRHHTANDKKFTTIENHEFLQPTFKYGEMQQSEATDKTANIYRFINILHKRTTVGSPVICFAPRSLCFSRAIAFF